MPELIAAVAAVAVSIIWTELRNSFSRAGREVSACVMLFAEIEGNLVQARHLKSRLETSGGEKVDLDQWQRGIWMIVGARVVAGTASPWSTVAWIQDSDLIATAFPPTTILQLFDHFRHLAAISNYSDVVTEMRREQSTGRGGGAGRTPFNDRGEAPTTGLVQNLVAVIKLGNPVKIELLGKYARLIARSRRVSLTPA